MLHRRLSRVLKTSPEKHYIEMKTDISSMCVYSSLSLYLKYPLPKKYWNKMQDLSFSFFFGGGGGENRFSGTNVFFQFLFLYILRVNDSKIKNQLTHFPA